MTRIQVFRHGGRAIGIRAEGHSGASKAGEYDLVCAAVSVLIQTLHIGLADLMELEVASQVDDSLALIEMRWPDEKSEAQRVLVETILKSLKELSRTYQDFVTYSEVSDHAVS